MNKKHMACAHWRPGDRCALGEDGVDDFCVLGPCSEEVPSHGDQLRNMSDEELAAFSAHRARGCPPGPFEEREQCVAEAHEGKLPGADRDRCYVCWLKWIQKEAEA